MDSFISPGLIKRYFAGECSVAEDLLVEKWLQASPENTQLALHWLENESENPNSQVVQQVLADENQVWHKTAELLQSPDERNNRLLPAATKTRKLPAEKALTKPYLKMAAVVSGFILMALAGYLYKQKQVIEVTVAYGQVKQVTLPDHSTVYLNGNSSLRYKPDWHQKREVWLTGEAFFEVTHQKNHRNFVVHLANKLAVEVLGTEFNVRDRLQSSDVVLKTGKVKLHLEQKFKKTQVFLQPGELVEVKNTNSSLTITRKEKVNTEQYVSWTYHKWVLDGTTLKQILQRIEETYGVHVVVINKALLQKRVSGSIPLPEKKAELLLQDVALLFEVNIRQHGDVVYLEDK